MAEATYNLTPTQYLELMRRLGPTYLGMDDGEMHAGMNGTAHPGSFTTTYLVRGADESERIARGSDAVRKDGIGAVARMDVHYDNPFSPGKPSGYVLMTSNTQITSVLNQMGIRPLQQPAQSAPEMLRQMAGELQPRGRSP